MKNDRSSLGFTLVEILVVLAILGALAGAALLAISGAGGGRLAETEANRLADRLTFAADEALVTDLPVRFNWDADGYVFLSLRDGEWQPHIEGPLAERHDLAGADIEEQSGTLDILPGGTGGTARFTLSGSRDWVVAFDGLTATAGPAT